MSIELSIKDARRIETMAEGEMSRTQMMGIKQQKAGSMQEAEELGVTLAESILDKLGRLNNLVFYIRREIRVLNDDSSIADNCNEIARLEALADILNKTRLPTAEYYEPYNRDGYYIVGINGDFTESKMLDIRRVQRSIQKLKDKCNGTNAQLKVQFSDEQAELMRRYAFID